MADVEILRRIALLLPEVTEEPHFEKISFRVNKKIFATVVSGQNRATVKLSAIDQDVFCAFDHSVIYPVPNKWGKQGWTHIDLLKIREDMLTDILKTAYCGIAPKKLADLVSLEG